MTTEAKHRYTYNSWQKMRSRCNRANDPGYQWYGAKGITVCERWSWFKNFLADMGERPMGTTIDRIDNKGNYEQENCRWATNAEQAANRSDSRLVEFRGEVKCLRDWIPIVKLPRDALEHRLNKGWDVEEAFTTPVGTRGVRRWCKRGHRLAGDNVLIDYKGTRRCRKCVEVFGSRFSPQRLGAVPPAEQDTPQ